MPVDAGLSPGVIVAVKVVELPAATGLGLAEPVPDGVARAPWGERKIIYRETIVGAGRVKIGPADPDGRPIGDTERN